MTAKFKRSSRIPALVFTIASGFALMALVGTDTMIGQQPSSRDPSDSSKAADSRLTSLGAGTNHSTHAGSR